MKENGSGLSKKNKGKMVEVYDHDYRPDNTVGYKSRSRHAKDVTSESSEEIYEESSEEELVFDSTSSDHLESENSDDEFTIPQQGRNARRAAARSGEWKSE